MLGYLPAGESLDVFGGGKKFTISEATGKLHTFGEDGCRLAARLSLLSKMRNARAHLDMGQLLSIRTMLASGSPSSPRPCPRAYADVDGGASEGVRDAAYLEVARLPDFARPGAVGGPGAVAARPGRQGGLAEALGAVTASTASTTSWPESSRANGVLERDGPADGDHAVGLIVDLGCGNTATRDGASQKNVSMSTQAVDSGLSEVDAYAPGARLDDMLRQARESAAWPVRMDATRADMEACRAHMVWEAPPHGHREDQPMPEHFAACARVGFCWASMRGMMTSGLARGTGAAAASLREATLCQSDGRHEISGGGPLAGSHAGPFCGVPSPLRSVGSASIRRAHPRWRYAARQSRPAIFRAVR